MHLVDAQILCDQLGHSGGVTGQHDGAHALCLQALHGGPGGRLFLIGNQDGAKELPVAGNVDNRACALGGGVVNMLALHQAGVAGQHGAAIHLRFHAVTRDLLRVGRTLGVQTRAGLAQALADGMVREALGQRRTLEQVGLGHAVGGGGVRDLENALRQGAGLVKHGHAGLGQGLEIVAALDEDTALGRAADTAEEGQRDRDDQCAGAADDQEGQRAHDPVKPVAQQQRRHNRQHQCAEADSGGVVAGELRDKVFNRRFLQAGIFHQVKDFCNGGLPINLRGPDAQHTVGVHTAADDLVPGAHGARAALAGQRCGIQGGLTGQDHAVQRDLLTGLDDDGRANGHIIGVNDGDAAVLGLQIRAVGADVHQRGDARTALADGVGLEQLADLVEQHNGHALGVLTAADGADRGDGHQEIFVKNFAVLDAHERLAQDIMAND